MTQLSPAEFTRLVVETDTLLIEEGLEPFQRPIHACSRIAKQLGRSFTIGQQPDPFVDAVHEVYRKLYRDSDLYMPPLHVGAFMFRDIFLPLVVFLAFGNPRINPVTSLQDVPKHLLERLFSDRETKHAYFDQWTDLHDFVYGLEDLSRMKTLPELSIEYWELAKQQLEGAAATLLGSIDKYTVIQNSAIAMELLLKGALFAGGVTEEELKKSYGHDMQKITLKACGLMPKADRALLEAVVARTPKLVERRYQAKAYKRTELGHVLMDAHYLAGEVLRQFSGRNFRASLTSADGEDYSKRHYPSLA